MRNTVSFHYAAPLVVVSDEDGVLSVQGADWFLDLLRTISGVDLDQNAVREDRGVVVRARCARRRYWIGLSTMGEHEWVAHVHHHSFAWAPEVQLGGTAHGWSAKSITPCA